LLKLLDLFSNKLSVFKFNPYFSLQLLIESCVKLALCLSGPLLEGVEESIYSGYRNRRRD
jgi:hypothetical protein